MLIDGTTLKRAAVAIVRYRNALDLNPRPGQFFQVTFDPAERSKSGEFIRFGNTHGDEIVGWARMEDLEIHEILHEFSANEQPPKIERSNYSMVASPVTVSAASAALVN